MNRLMKGFKKSMEAVAFAEAGEFATAQEIMREPERPGKVVKIGQAAPTFSEKIEGIQEAVAFAEAGEFDTARQIMKKLKKDADRKKAAHSETKQTESIADKIERTAEAVTFAEAGEHEHAKMLIAREESERQKILVVGGEEDFSEALINYAISMAKRMNYEIVALNVFKIGKRLFNVLNEKHVTEEIEAGIQGGKEAFMKQAEEAGIPFRHLSKFGSFDKIVKDTHKEIKRISFVLAEPTHICKSGSGSCANIPVFCLASGE